MRQSNPLILTHKLPTALGDLTLKINPGLWHSGKLGQAPVKIGTVLGFVLFGKTRTPGSVILAVLLGTLVSLTVTRFLLISRVVPVRRFCRQFTLFGVRKFRVRLSSVSRWIRLLKFVLRVSVFPFGVKSGLIVGTRRNIALNVAVVDGSLRRSVGSVELYQGPSVSLSNRLYYNPRINQSTGLASHGRKLGPRAVASRMLRPPEVRNWALGLAPQGQSVIVFRSICEIDYDSTSESVWSFSCF